MSPQQVLDWHWLEEIDVLFASNNWLPHDCWHTFYIDVDAKPYHFTHHDVMAASRSDLEHMRWLYLQGYQRAVILHVNTPGAFQYPDHSLQKSNPYIATCTTADTYSLPSTASRFASDPRSPLASRAIA